MNFEIFIVGDKIESLSKSAINEYEKRLSRYCKTKLIAVKNSTILEKKIKDKSYIINLTTNDIQYTSEEFAEKINKHGVDGFSSIVFLIGDHEIDVNESMSLSQMTLNVGTLTTVLYEQIYRAYRILNNHPYHK